jgi:hypothetical protein
MHLRKEWTIFLPITLVRGLFHVVGQQIATAKDNLIMLRDVELLDMRKWNSRE